MTTTATSSSPGWIRPEDARLSDLLEVLTARTDLADYPHATRVEQEVLVYDWATLRHTAADDASRRDVQAELARALSDGPRDRRAGRRVRAGDPGPDHRGLRADDRRAARQRCRGR